MQIGDRFPEMTLALADGGSLPLPEGLGPGWGGILFYRGHF